MDVEAICRLSHVSLDQTSSAETEREQPAAAAASRPIGASTHLVSSEKWSP